MTIGKMSKTNWFGLVVAFIFLDQLSKYLFVTYWPDLVHYNTGSAFSLPIPMIVAVIISFAFIALAIYMHGRDKLSDWIWLLIFAGTVGNLIDRLFRGSVTDFIDVGFWPVFNLADTYLSTAGLMLFVFYVILGRDYGRTK